MKRLILSAMLSLAFAGAANSASYNIDASHTQVHFSYSHGGNATLSGRFMEVTGTFDFDAAKPANSSIAVELPISSLSTGVPKLDAHLSSADFFDVEKFPTASFKSTKVTALGGNKLSVAGELTLHGVTKPAVLDVTINKSGIDPRSKVGAAGFDAKTTIKRSEFGISRNLPMIPDEVVITIGMEAREPKPEAAKAG